MVTQEQHDLAVEAAKSAPPVVVTATAWAGVDWNILVLVLTAIYVALQIVLTIRKLLRERREDDNDEPDH